MPLAKLSDCPVTQEIVYGLRASGMSIEAISQHTGLSDITVRRLIKLQTQRLQRQEHRELLAQRN